MNVTASVVLTTCCRTKHLFWYLKSLSEQCLVGIDLEVLVVNDGLEDDTEEVVKSFEDQLQIRYLFTGQRNKSGLIRRAMGFAANIGIRQVKSEIVVLSCADLYLLPDALCVAVHATRDDPMALGTPREIYDDDGRLIDYLSGSNTRNLSAVIREVKSLPLGKVHCDPELPYFMAVRREHLLAIRGYDEDFIGYACEDDDLICRLVRFGCRHSYTCGEAIHLFHGVRDANAIAIDPAYIYNLALLNQRRSLVVRNVGREWGVL